MFSPRVKRSGRAATAAEGREGKCFLEQDSWTWKKAYSATTLKNNNNSNDNSDIENNNVHDKNNMGNNNNNKHSPDYE